MAAGAETFLFPNDAFSPSRPDDYFAEEYDAAVSAGFATDLIDHDAVVAGDLRTGLKRVRTESTSAIYRGWMVTPPQYAAMEVALRERGVELRTDSDSFARAHHLPSWYSTFEPFTPVSAWTETPDRNEFVAALESLEAGPAVLKDYSKSLKHNWDEAMFIADVRDVDAAVRVADRFVELRGPSLDVGFVVRRFEELEHQEIRTWWVDGQCVAVTAHPDQPDEMPAEVDVEAFAPSVAALGAPFVTVDFVKSSRTGELRIMEVGDGQVSDRPSTTAPHAFIAAIAGLGAAGEGG